MLTQVRMIIKAKGIEDQFNIASPSSLGGVKSPEFLQLNSHGKVPLLVTEDGLVIAESDTIARYMVEKFADRSPTFVPKNTALKYLSESIVRTHDLYISCLQGCMYKAPGTSFSVYGTDRKAALEELKRQLLAIEQNIHAFDERHPSLRRGPYLCGEDISLADATLYPTMIFCEFMLPQFFGVSQSEYMGPILRQWWSFISDKVDCAKVINKEISEPLSEWKTKGRFEPIMAEMLKV